MSTGNHLFPFKINSRNIFTYKKDKDTVRFKSQLEDSEKQRKLYSELSQKARSKDEVNKLISYPKGFIISYNNFLMLKILLDEERLLA